MGGWELRALPAAVGDRDQPAVPAAVEPRTRASNVVWRGSAKVGRRLPEVSGSGEGKEEEAGWGKGSLAEGRGGVDARQRGSAPLTLLVAKRLVAGKPPGFKFPFCSSGGCFWGYDAARRQGRQAWSSGSPPGPCPAHLDLKWHLLHIGLVTVGWDRPRPLFLSRETLPSLVGFTPSRRVCSAASTH